MESGQACRTPAGSAGRKNPMIRSTCTNTVTRVSIALVVLALVVVVANALAGDVGNAPQGLASPF
jgi:hypothetical protein